MAFGGGGAEGELNNGLIDSAAAVLLFVLIGSHWTGRRPLPDVAVIVVGLIVALQLITLMQLVPLPSPVWSKLSGRELPAAALGLTPFAGQMRPLSLDPEATRRFCTALFLPAAIVLGVLGSTKRDLRLLLWAAVAAGALSALIGSLQLALGAPQWLSFFEGSSPGVASGSFANANHQAAFLCSVLFILALLLRIEDGQLDLRPVGLKVRLHAGWVLVPIFAIMIIATGSRAGTAALPLVLLASLIIAIRMRSAVKAVAIILLISLIVGLAVLFYPSDNSLALRETFLFGDDIRYAYLPDIQYTLREYWPYGSGFGTFRTVFPHNETLDIATAGILNHAHNDVLEWLIEAGAAGAAWLFALVIATAWLFYKAISKGGDQGRRKASSLAITGVLLLVTIGLMSLVDYPTRTRAVLAVCALGFALVIRAVRSPALHKPAKASGTWLLPAVALVGLAVGLQTLRIRAAQAAAWSGDGAAAVAIRPQNGQGYSLAAEVQLASRHLPAARTLALRALMRSPLDPAAVRTLAVTAPGGGASSNAWTVAANMGWRDPPTQVWAMRRAFRNGEFEIAALRADALLRTGREAGTLFLGQIRSFAQNPEFRREFLKRLALNPGWRLSFFSMPADVPDEQLQAAVATLRDLASGGAKPRRAEARDAIAALINKKRYSEALALYHLVVGPQFTSGRTLTDSGFGFSTDDYLTKTTPFDWRITNQPGANASIEASGRRTLLISSDGETKAQVASRYVALAPGNHLLSYQRRGSADSPEGIAVVVSCANNQTVLGRSSAAPLTGEQFHARRMQFAVPASCPLVLIAFETQANGTPATAEFDDVEVTP
jgi:O-antigen ligase